MVPTLYKQPIIVYGKTPINVREHLDDTLPLSARGHKLAYQEMRKNFPEIKESKEILKKLTRTIINRKPTANHPWRLGLDPAKQTRL